jgi:hypothetical protein
MRLPAPVMRLTACAHAPCRTPSLPPVRTPSLPPVTLLAVIRGRAVFSDRRYRHPPHVAISGQLYRPLFRVYRTNYRVILSSSFFVEDLHAIHVQIFHQEKSFQDLSLASEISCCYPHVRPQLCTWRAGVGSRAPVWSALCGREGGLCGRGGGLCGREGGREGQAGGGRGRVSRVGPGRGPRGAGLAGLGRASRVGPG